MGIKLRAAAIGVIPESYEILSRQLSPNEFTLHRADDYEQVKELLTQGIPDIVFLAMDKEKYDPFKLCLVLSKAGAAVMVISRTPTREVLINSAKHGAADLLVSPLQADALAKKIEVALIKAGKKALPEGFKFKLDFESAKTPFEKVKLLIKKVEKLLALPFSVVKIIQLCNDPLSNTSDIERPIKSDPAIAAMIMKRANSAAYGGMGPVRSIQRAIVRIGMRSTRNIAASFSVLKLFSKKEKNLGFNRAWFWMHSLTTGICAQLIASELKFKHPEDFFIAGLLHDIGKMILDDFMNEEYYKAIQMANTNGISIRDAELKVFDVSHAYIGSKVAQSWEFPHTIIESIEKHHSYTQLANVGSGASMSAIVCIANQMTKAIQAGNSGDFLAHSLSLPLWHSVSKNISWKKIVNSVFDELKLYVEILEVPPEQVEIKPPKNTGIKAGIFLPKEVNYGDLLQIALHRKGIDTVRFSSFEDPSLKLKKFDFIIGDLSSVEKTEDVRYFQQKLAEITENYIILPAFNKDEKPFNLDFFWLEREIAKYIADSSEDKKGQ